MVKTLDAVQVRATNALADWKYSFSRSVRRNAHAIAVRDGHSDEITEKHYQLAAQIALQELAEQISVELHDGKKEAA